MYYIVSDDRSIVAEVEKTGKFEYKIIKIIKDHDNYLKKQVKQNNGSMVISSWFIFDDKRKIISVIFDRNK